RHAILRGWCSQGRAGSNPVVSTLISSPCLPRGFFFFRYFNLPYITPIRQSTRLIYHELHHCPRQRLLFSRSQYPLFYSAPRLPECSKNISFPAHWSAGNKPGYPILSASGIPGRFPDLHRSQREKPPCSRNLYTGGARQAFQQYTEGPS